jgi:hypothetical protein
VRKSVLGLAAICTVATMAVFQNCAPGGSAVLEASSRVGATSVTTNPYYTYKNYGDCGSATAEIQTEIHLSKDGTSAEMVTQNCVPVSESIDPAQLQFGLNNTSVFMYQGLIFDIQTAPQRVTSTLCVGATLDVAVWSLSNNKTALLGAVNLSSGMSTGSLNVTSPSARMYTSGAAVGGSGLSLNASAGSVQYTINGISQTDSAIACYDQPVP